ncbi:origin recognition complex subunit 3 [Pyrenophora seminiperda CCB06]|uniref:Origin recognition complex subunit 3 n=1 Tax=Pyrenophora seminiperda CCB06 TaxID=1302712 RepID=A0A3M7LWP9_9PLEO|nr:origin recognition complex subunit 3 [Pyrenophora seminiperda CCB06]
MSLTVHASTYLNLGTDAFMPESNHDTLQSFEFTTMEHQRCYIYELPEAEERAPKRQRTGKLDPQAQLSERLIAYRELWEQQEEQIQSTLEGADSATQEKIADFISTSSTSPNEPKFAIPTALIVAGPSIASHGPFFERLGRRIRQENSAYIVLTSGECPNLKTLLKNLIKKVTSRIEDDDDDDVNRPSASSRNGPKLLNYDLSHVHVWQKKNQVHSIVVALQDSEGFDVGLLGDVVDILHSWLDRLPFVLLFGIATSAENFEERLSGDSLRYLEGQKFDVTQSDEIIERLFAATIASTDVCLQIGPILCRRMLDRQKDHVQNTQDFCDGLKYAYMSHFYASLPSLFLKQNIAFGDLTADVFEAVRNLPSFKRWVEGILEDGRAQDVRKVLEDNSYLFNQITQHIRVGQQALSTLSHASKVLASIRESLPMSPSVRLSAIWTRAAAGDLDGSPLIRETMLSIKKVPSDKLVHCFGSLKDLEGDYFSLDMHNFQQRLECLLKNADAPLRTQHDVRNDSVRTTVVAQKVLLSKHKAALSEQDKAYSDLVTDFHDKLEAYFTSSFVEPKTLFLSEVLMYDLKSPHTEVFQPKPRLAVERALATPHDYLGCECCSGVDGNPAALSTTQPAAAIVYQLYLESGTLINVTDLWSAFNAIAGDGTEENEPNTMALFQRALAELRHLGLVKPSRKKTDHISKIMWKGL